MRLAHGNKALMIDRIVAVSRVIPRHTKVVEMLAWVQDSCSSGRTKFRATPITVAGNRPEIINIGKLIPPRFCKGSGTIIGQDSKYQSMVQRYRSVQELGTLWFKFKLKTVNKCLVLRALSAEGKFHGRYSS